MAVVQTILLVLGVALFAFGYVKTHRNRMLVGALLVVAAFVAPDFAAGFREGYAEARATH